MFTPCAEVFREYVTPGANGELLPQGRGCTDKFLGYLYPMNQLVKMLLLALSSLSANVTNRLERTGTSCCYGGPVYALPACLL